MERDLRNISALRAFAQEFLEALRSFPDRATIVGLSGDLGSGKTAFVKEAAGLLGVEEEVLSPTFVIAKFYDLHGAKWKRLVHIDAYRIERPEEIRALKWDTITRDPNNLVFIEWPEQLGALFPTDAQILHFQFIDETTRSVQ